MENRTELIRFGEQLRLVRQQQRLTVADLAERSSISPTRVAKLEAGLTDPSRILSRPGRRTIRVDPRGRRGPRGGIASLGPGSRGGGPLRGRCARWGWEGHPRA
jgi:hypothetical protein